MDTRHTTTMQTKIIKICRARNIFCINTDVQEILTQRTHTHTWKRSSVDQMSGNGRIHTP